ncbi:hypothetical protein VITFI_CDS1186 [Vitreoscilla filiformis]|jgi:hypothetical protein|uniref:Uncharacterized protein n=1 Tax=Vitreoscilla filiformis TaxID=63 RepID=A0A221KD39_VITFI|nr:hypothetical protein [Vitreoscilla filiformis]ASM76964.1 hypothetical protein VITFI_CDS1186 [Vitreoscilla filiformis]
MSVLADVWRFIWRAAGLMLALGVVAGLVIMGMIVWLVARLLGRRPPPVRVQWPRQGEMPFGFRQRPGTPAASDDSVVDVQVREVAERSEALPGPGTKP